MFSKKAFLSLGVAALIVPIAFGSATGNCYYPVSCSPIKASIDVEKYVSVEPNWDVWYDADTPEDALNVGLDLRLKYKFVITNNGNVALNNITVTDSMYDGRVDYMNQLAAHIVDPLQLGDSFEFEIFNDPDTIRSVAGYNTNTSTATGYYGPTMVSDTDSAVYYGN